MRVEDRGRNLWATVTADMQRYVGESVRPWTPGFIRGIVRAAYTHPGLLAVLIYRYGQWVQFRCRVPIARQICDAYYYFLYSWARTRLQIEVPRTAAIDAGFRIMHFGSIILNSHVVAGKNLTVGPGVIVGTSNKGGVPQLGDNVEINAGAKIFGPITIGNDVVIGAQAVVNKDVPNGAIVAGVPARVIRIREKSQESCGQAIGQDSIQEVRDQSKSKEPGG